MNEAKLAVPHCRQHVAIPMKLMPLGEVIQRGRYHDEMLLQEGAVRSVWRCTVPACPVVQAAVLEPNRPDCRHCGEKVDGERHFLTAICKRCRQKTRRARTAADKRKRSALTGARP